MQDQSRQALLAQANQYNNRMSPQNKGNFFTSLLPTIGGIGGGILGSFAGPGIGTLAGGAAGAGLGKTIQNMLEGKQDIGEGVLGEAAFGTLGGIGKGIKAVSGAGKALKSGQGVKSAGNILRYGPQTVPKVAQSVSAPGMLGRAGKGMENLSKSMLGSQSQITAAQARSMGINPQKALGSVNKRTGLTKLDDMAEVSRSLTGGKDSMLDMLTREAVGSTSGVKVPDLHATAKSLLDDMGSLVPEGKRKLLLNNAVHAGSAMRGGSKGSLSALANPQLALDQANAFRDSARKLTSSFSATPADKQLAKVYNSLASTVEKNIYKSPGVSESVPTLVKAGADDLLFRSQELRAAGNGAQAKALEKVAQDLRGVKDVSGLRKFKKDFVDVGKIDDATAQAQGTRNMGGADLANRAGSIIRNPMNLLAAPLDAATPAVAGVLSRGGQALQGAGGGLDTAKRLLTSPGAKIAGTQLGGRALMGGLPGQGGTKVSPSALDPMAQQLPAGWDSETYNNFKGANPNLEPNAQDTAMMQGTGGDSVYTREAVAKDIQADLAATGGENMEKYITLFNFLNPEGGAGGANATTQKALAQSGNADATLSQLEALLQQAGGASGPVGGNVSSFFGGLGLNNDVKAYNDLVGGSVTQIAKALGETGAMSDQDRAAYGMLLPRVTDTPEVAAQKFAALRERMATAQQNTLQYGAGTGIEDALAAAGY